MRPVRNKQHPIQAPLNGILGREANVRVLRALAANVEPISISSLAELTGLHISGIVRTVAQLEEIGVVETVGVGKRRPVRLRRGHPLAPALSTLFRAEGSRMDTILIGLMEAAQEIKPLPLSAWIQDPVMEDPDLRANAVTVVLLGEERDFDAAVASFKKALGDLEKLMDVTFEFRSRTEAELARGTGGESDAFRHVFPLLGPHPNLIVDYYRRQRGEDAGPDRARYEAELEARVLRLASAVALRLRTDPSLIEHARATTAKNGETDRKKLH